MADSRVSTYEHITKVRAFLLACIIDLLQRQQEHDATKLESPEREAYDTLDDTIRSYEYGSEGYRAALREIKPAIEHHYAAYRHHVEHHAEGMRDMNLIDLLEMVCDWCAASQRQPNGMVRGNMDKNQERYGFTDETKQFLLNTVDFLDPAGALR